MSKKRTIEKENHSYEILPLLTLDNLVVVPEIPQPIKIEDENQKSFIDKCYNANNEIFIATTNNPSGEKSRPGELKEDSIQKVGIVCIIDRVLQMPGAPTLAFIRPLCRGIFNGIVFSPSLQMAKVVRIKNLTVKRTSKQFEFLVEHIDSLFGNLMNFLVEQEKETAMKLVYENSQDPIRHLYAITQVSPLNWEEKYQVISSPSAKELAETLALLLDESLEKIKIQASIHEKTHRELSQQQKETFLRVHLKNIKEELGEVEETNDVENLLKRAANKNWNPEAREHFDKEIQKFKRLTINNPEYSIQYSYLDTLLGLPWDNYNHSDFNLGQVEEILDRDHYGLDKVKERIIEHMAVLKLRDDLKAPIICLYGPPGVGKTSIGKSIAEATGREYSRIALGGLHDESEIRGHRKTYIGSMPGRFIQALSKLKYGNPLILLDEVDKVGKDYKGDPSSALLEALDPEQNNTFHDNFIDFPYDLSKVLFIATANDLSTIPSPLRDRMEIIEMTGYIPEEKREIALRHLVEKAHKENGLNGKEINFTPEAIDFIIRYYTREAGVRQLEKKISKILRKIVRLKVSKKKFPKKITPEIAEELLGKREVRPESYENNDYAGVATGLAWTPAGGDVLEIETSLSRGKGEKIVLTGNLGDVMKESAAIALKFIKANAEKLNINQDLFEKYDIHIHVPEGAVPKDGPSAGITLASSLLSAFTGRKMKERTAMTGELTLRGKVLPVGGIKEKIIAARTAGIRYIILSEENKRDVEEIHPRYIEGLEFIYVKNLTEVFENGISDEKAPFHFNLKSN